MTEEDAIQAGELALGVLDGEERAAALRRVLAEPAFAAQVARWREHLAVLVAAIPAVEPSGQLERRVLGETRSERRSVGRWRLTAAAMSAVAACLAVAMLWPARAPVPIARPTPQVLVAALAGTEGGKPFTAVYDARAGKVAIVGAAPWAADRSAELWAIAPGASPRPLGLIGRGARSGVAVPGGERAIIAPGVTLAVSIEPDGGSPTGLPTGPVVATGELMTA